jgi:pheromone shutdown protein TraB
MLFLPKIEKRWLGAIVALIGLATILVPQAWVIGICAKDTMSCHTTIWWLYVEGLLTMALGLGIWSGLIKDGAE